MFPSHLLDWEQAVSQATAIEGDEANAVGDNQVKTWDDKVTARAMPDADARGNN